MAKYKIELNQKDCTACQACVASCDASFEMGKDADGNEKAVVKTSDVDDLGCCMDAAQVCPVQCIHITEVETGKKLI